MRVVNLAVLLVSMSVIGCGATAPSSEGDGGGVEASVVTLIVLNPSDTSVQVGNEFTATATVYDQFSNIMAATVNWSIVTANGAISIDPSGLSCGITGLQVGTGQVMAVNGSVNAFCDVTVLPIPPDPPQITSPAAGTMETAYEGYTYGPIQWTATGGQGAKTWTIISGSLPDGLSLDEDGYLTGWPQYGTGGITYYFTVQVSDEAGTDSRDHELYVEYGDIIFF